jgi:histone H4
MEEKKKPVKAKTKLTARPKKKEEKKQQPDPANYVSTVLETEVHIPVSGGKLVSGTGKRHRQFRDNIQGITNPAIRRLARRGGIKRISKAFYEEVRGNLRLFLEKVVRTAVIYTQHAKQQTVTYNSMTQALKHHGTPVWGADVGKSQTFQRTVREAKKKKMDPTATAE